MKKITKKKTNRRGIIAKGVLKICMQINYVKIFCNFSKMVFVDWKMEFIEKSEGIFRCLKISLSFTKKYLLI